MIAHIALLYTPFQGVLMTSTTVPATISTLLRAIEARDLATIHAAFTSDAAIHDEGEVVRGPAGVERWATRVFGYAPTFSVDDVSDNAGETIVTTTTTGDFPGGRLVSRWHLTFASDRIASLRIEV
jgi:SnoaL-like protein